MTNKETVTRNIGLTLDFVNHLNDHPEIMENLPDNFKLNFVEADFSNTTKNVVDKSRQKISEKYVKVKNTFEIGT